MRQRGQKIHEYLRPENTRVPEAKKYTSTRTWGQNKQEKLQDPEKYMECAADFSLLNLPKGKSLGRSKPATNS